MNNATALAPNGASATDPSADLPITVFSSRDDAHGHRQSSTYAALLDDLRQPFERERPKEELPLWSPATFRDDYRNKENVESARAVGFDVDVSAPSREELLAALKGRAGFFYCSSSHTTAKPRWRLILVLSRPVNAAEYARIWRAVAASLPFTVAIGREAKDASRQWYLPREPAEGEYIFEELVGAPVDVEAMLAIEEEVPEVDAELPTEGSRWLISAGNIEDASQILARHFKDGQRHAMSLEIAGACAWSGLSVADAVAFLCRVAELGPEGNEDAAKRVRAVKRTYLLASTGSKVTGWPSIEERVGTVVARRAREVLLGLDAWRSFVAARSGHANDVEEAKEDEPRARPSAADRALALGERMTRLATGFPTLDRATRGGFPVGKTAVIGGAPGAGKTTTAVQLAFRWLCAGVHVGILAADEDANGLLVRFGQLAGLDRAKIEEGDPATVAKLSAWCRSVPLLLWDQDEDRVTLEEASAELRTVADGTPSVIVADSIQKVRTAHSTEAKDLRQRIDVVVSALQACAKVDRHLVIATSELARGAYRNRDQAEATNPLAAFKESGGIEYGFGAALVMRNRPGTNDLVEVTVAKNRFGGERPDLLLRLNFDRAQVTEDTLLPAKSLDPLAPYKTRLLEAATRLAGSPVSKTALAEMVAGRGTLKLKAIEALLEDGVLFQERRGIRLPCGTDSLPEAASG